MNERRETAPRGLTPQDEYWRQALDGNHQHYQPPAGWGGGAGFPLL